jgi:hypothetical protein
VRITKTFALAAAEAFQTIPTEDSAPFNFVYISGLGATFKPGFLTPIFGRVKGETELALAEMRKKNPNFHAMSIRPGAIDSTDHEAIKPYVPKMGVMASTTLAVLRPLLRAPMKSSWSPTIPLGQFMVEMAMGKRNGLEGPGVDKVGDFPVIENGAFWRAMDTLPDI